MSTERVVKFRAFADFSKFSVMLEDVSIHTGNNMVGLAYEAFAEILEPTDWKVNDEYEFENKKTGETFGHDTVKVYDSGEDYFFFEDTKLMQFTGYKDSEGNEVFEGDTWERGGFIGTIVFQYGGWEIWPHPKSNNIQYPAFHSNIGTGKIIGHIYSKPSPIKENSPEDGVRNIRHPSFRTVDNNDGV